MNKQRGVAKTEKKPIIFEENEEGIDCYDGERYGCITEEQKKEIRSMRTEYILVRKSKRDRKKLRISKAEQLAQDIGWEDKTLKELYKEFIRDAQMLKFETQGLINMYRTGSDAKTSVELAYHFLNQNNISADPIGEQEAIWIEEATIGGIAFGEMYEGEAWQYDINSSYPSIYSSVNFLVPIKEGEFRKITEEEFEQAKATYFTPGIYCAEVIIPSENGILSVEQAQKLFRLNKRYHRYTHIDLNYAKMIGLEIKWINTDTTLEQSYNFLKYSREKMLTGSQCFKQFVDLLYPLKQHPIIGGRCKSLLNSLWGALCQTDTTNFKKSIDEEVTVFDHNDLESLMISGDRLIYGVVDRMNRFSTPYARMKPFLLAKGRVKISRIMAPYVDHIHRSHTDSLLSDIELPIKKSMKIGELKFEKHYTNCMVININKVREI